MRIVVGFSAGSVVDISARIVGQKLFEKWQQQVIVDNRPSAGGIIAAQLAAGAIADGYTLLSVSASHAVAPAIYAKLPYDTIKDFAGITTTVSSPALLVVSPSLGPRSVQELIALAKARPGELSYASSGNFLYLSGALFTSLAKISMLHVPFKGGAQAMPAVMSGEVALSFATVVSGLPHVQQGRLRGLAVTSAERFPTAATYPTVAESGLPGYEAVAWYGVFAPAGTPQDVVQKLNADIVRIVQAPDVRELMLKQGATSYATSPEAFAGVVRRDVAKWSKIVRESGAKPD